MVESNYVSGRDGTARGNYTSLMDAGADIKAAYEAQADTNAYTDAEKSKLGGLGGGASLTVPAGTGIEAFNGTSPTAWTDLDLSGTVGSNATLVLLKVYLAGLQKAIAFRKNGDTDEYYTTSTADSRGCALIESVAAFLVTIVVTDNLGKIEWKTEQASFGSTVGIIAYIK